MRPPRSLLLGAILLTLSPPGLPAQAGSQPQSQTASQTAPRTVARARPLEPAGPPTGVLVLLDASSTMEGTLRGGGERWPLAVEAVQAFVEGPFDGLELGLRAYGGRGGAAVPFGPPEETGPAIAAAAAGLAPGGLVDLGTALEAARVDFEGRTGHLVLLAGGVTAALGDPCERVAGWRTEGLKVQLHVVGFGVSGSTKRLLQCMAEAAGPSFRHVSSPAEAEVAMQVTRRRTTSTALYLDGSSTEGEELPVHGILWTQKGTLDQVASTRRNEAAPGRYVLRYGVRTADGAEYRSRRRGVDVAPAGDTVLAVKVLRPPSVVPRFAKGAEAPLEKGARAFREGEEVARLPWAEDSFLSPGLYQLRVFQDADNELVLPLSIDHGERREAVFERIPAVAVRVALVAEGSGRPLDDAVELLAGGARRYLVDRADGALAAPGTYAVRVEGENAPLAGAKVEVVAGAEQSFVVRAAAGDLTVRFETAAGEPDRDHRFFVEVGEDRPRRLFEGAGTHPLRPGSYLLRGPDGRYPPHTIEIRAGEETAAVLKPRW